MARFRRGLAAMLLYITLPPRLDDRSDLGRAADVLSSSSRSRSSFRGGIGETRRTRFWSILLIVLVNFFNLASVLLLDRGVLSSREGARCIRPGILLRTGAQIWFTNILGLRALVLGARRRRPRRRAHANAATEFRERRLPVSTDADDDRQRRPRRRASTRRWKPQFLDYLYLAFTERDRVQPRRRDAAQPLGQRR